MADKEGFSKIEQISRFCYFVGLGVGLLGIFCVTFGSVFQSAIPKLLPGCFFYKKTGYYCPGCGGTRAVMALLRGEFLRSFCYHPFVIYMVAYYAIYEVSYTISYITHGKVRGVLVRPMHFYVGIALILMQWVVKNYLRYAYGFLL